MTEKTLFDPNDFMSPRHEMVTVPPGQLNQKYIRIGKQNISRAREALGERNE